MTLRACELPPVKGFWSLTLYDAEHFFHPNPQNRYSLGTKNKTLKYNADGSLTLYAGASSPGAGKREQLAACSEWSVLTLHPRILGRAAYFEPTMDASCRAFDPVSSKGGDK